MTDRLIDTTEMYLKALFEMEEDGVIPLRARLVDRFGHRAPTVSGTVARLARGGLVRLRSDRRIDLAEPGRLQAVRVARKHRLLETFLHQVVGLEWYQVHVEACQWEHVISDRVEQLIFELCGRPRFSPHGNPLPGLEELLPPEVEPVAPVESQVLPAAALAGRTEVAISRVSERVQDDVPFIRALHDAGALPGTRVEIEVRSGREIALHVNGSTLALTQHQAETLMITEVPA
ncbi:metal-dependent transcriptional regulator [Saccharopolyspora indica]|uniref:metal-dependent transcriptional regulator n=1 Tax=Saccharopolyspora indica TaxID=1229659 RepID=UPI0022EB906A|nr:metal-dependent transcriptional regulator [Saccharopolyspora indica]MDA3645317.1 metal-dependent transcriptional regulator [Saccharopolyspora indica]